MEPSLKLAEIRARYVDGDRPLPKELEERLREDPRSGAQAILRAIERRRRARRAEGQRLRRMLRFEQELWTSGVVHVAGVDEAGMSPLAGPVSAGAVVLAPGTRLADVDDSKKLTAAERERLAVVIKESAVAWAVGFATPEEIDRINIHHAGLLAMRRAVEGLAVAPAHLLLDARLLKDLAIPQQKIVKGDSRSLSIAAASILAKTARDALMSELDATYPGYGFARHKGYPVKEHVAALQRLGACVVHRRSFAPVREALGLPPLAPDHWKTTPRDAPMTTG
ncbi:MAG: ribonuclease HII [Labilithrix sp.]|nr:ribonuclease HII [Labilithrix sp.]MCW5814998.1 ribonuclease HII [Labilithrix sp.]